MTLVAQRPAQLGEPEHEHHPGPSGILKWLTSTDHKVIGRSYLITSFFFFLHGRGDGGRSCGPSSPRRTTRSSPSTPSTSCSRCTASLMLYLFAGPFAFGGLANYIVPLQVGAPDMAFPRLNALSYWLYLDGRAHDDRRLS